MERQNYALKSGLQGRARQFSAITSSRAGYEAAAAAKLQKVTQNCVALCARAKELAEAAAAAIAHVTELETARDIDNAEWCEKMHTLVVGLLSNQFKLPHTVPFPAALDEDAVCKQIAWLSTNCKHQLKTEEHSCKALQTAYETFASDHNARVDEVLARIVLSKKPTAHLLSVCEKEFGESFPNLLPGRHKAYDKAGIERLIAAQVQVFLIETVFESRRSLGPCNHTCAGDSPDVVAAAHILIGQPPCEAGILYLC